VLRAIGEFEAAQKNARKCLFKKTGETGSFKNRTAYRAIMFELKKKWQAKNYFKKQVFLKVQKLLS